MTINLPSFGMAKSVWPKVFAAIGLVAKFFAVQYYTNVTFFICGLTAYAFWNMIGDAAVLLGVFVSRQDNMPSEIAGAGNVPPPVGQDDELLKAQIAERSKELAELQKKLEGK